MLNAPKHSAILLTFIKPQFIVKIFVLSVLQYANDAAIFAQSAESLQHLLNGIQHYCDTWHLTNNTNKTRIWYLKKEGIHTLKNT